MYRKEICKFQRELAFERSVFYSDSGALVSQFRPLLPWGKASSSLKVKICEKKRKANKLSLESVTRRARRTTVRGTIANRVAYFIRNNKFGRRNGSLVARIGAQTVLESQTRKCESRSIRATAVQSIRLWCHRDGARNDRMGVPNPNEGKLWSFARFALAPFDSNTVTKVQVFVTRNVLSRMKCFKIDAARGKSKAYFVSWRPGNARRDESRRPKRVTIRRLGVSRNRGHCCASNRRRTRQKF